MVQDIKHKNLLTFIRKILGVPLGYSKDDLIIFRSIASRQYPTIVPLIDSYIDLAEESDTSVIKKNSSIRSTRRQKNANAEMHLFDMLRDSRLFPLNTDLAEFAVRIMPNIPRGRFAKISRVEIAARIVDYLETLSPQTRKKLEASMRDAMATHPDKQADPASFFSKWERIIKGT